MNICRSNRRPGRGWTYIYALVNVKFGTLIYVGKTRQGLRHRLQQHWGEPQDWHITLQWEIVLLDRVRNRDAEAAELHWIWEMRRRGHQLHNRRIEWIDHDYFPRERQMPLAI